VETKPKDKTGSYFVAIPYQAPLGNAYFLKLSAWRIYANTNIPGSNAGALEQENDN
jgi:hypothetical protein